MFLANLNPRAALYEENGPGLTPIFQKFLLLFALMIAVQK